MRQLMDCANVFSTVNWIVEKKKSGNKRAKEDLQRNIV